jgi:hypothetical protein
MKKLIFVTVLALALPASAAIGSETAKGMQKDYDQFKKEMQVKIDEAQKKIDEIKAQGKESGHEAHAKAVHELEVTRDQLRTQLAEAKADSASKWAKFKKSFAESVDSLNSKIQKALKD